MINKPRLELSYVFYRSTIGESAGGIDRNARFGPLFTPIADGIKVFQNEPDGINSDVAGCAGVF